MKNNETLSKSIFCGDIIFPTRTRKDFLQNLKSQNLKKSICFISLFPQHFVEGLLKFVGESVLSSGLEMTNNSSLRETGQGLLL